MMWRSLLSMLENEVIVDDDVVLETAQLQLLKLFEDRYFPWFLCEDKTATVSPIEYKRYSNKLSNIFEYTQFTHTFINKGDVTSNFIELPLSVLEKIAAKYNFSAEVVRVKANLCTKVSVENTEAHQTPHIDNIDSHWVMIYYVNNSDGDTFLFDSKLNVKQRITPKQGRCLLFNGATLHAGMHPKQSNYRIVINFNFFKL